MNSLETTRAVLVIEDDDDVRELLLSHLRNLGCTAYGAGSGIAGTELARLHRPEVIVVDILLPDIDGRLVIRALREDPRTAGTRVVLNSVLDLEDYRHTIADLGIDGVLPKPFTKRDVALLLGLLDVVPAPTGEAAA